MEFALGQNLVLLRSDGAKVYPPFLRWLVRGPEWWDQVNKFLNVGAIFDSLKCADIPNFQLRIPLLEAQHAIAHILGSLDDKIELNRQTNATLEAIAQAMFKEWFVDFNFPLSVPRLEGLADYRDYVAALPSGQSPNQENQGVDRVESALGLIPCGWRVGRLGEACELAYGKTLKSENRQDGEYPVVGSNGIVGVHAEFLVKGPGIVIGRKGTIGEVTWLHQNFFSIDTTFYIKDLLGVNTLYFHYFLLKMQDFKKIGSDSAVPGLHRNQAYDNTVIIPVTETIKLFNTLIQPIFEDIFNNTQQITTLTQLRDSLLPKLMRGEIVV